MRRTLFVVAACAGTLLGGGSARAQGAGEPFQIRYFKQVKELSLDGSRLAVLAPEGADARAAAAGALAAAGVGAAAVEAWPIRGWALVTLAPGSMARHAAQARALADRVAATGLVAMASPVFFGEDGGPMWPTPGILVGAANPGVDAPAGLEQVGRVSADPGQPGMYRIATDLRRGAAVLDAANRLAERPDLAFAEPDMIFTGRSALIPNDPGFPQQWGMHNTGQGGGVVDADIDAPEAWDIQLGIPSIRVVIIDTGMQQNHPDINQIAGMDFTGQGGGGGPVNQCDNHGTAVGGCVTMIINNALGGAGVAPNARCASARPFISTIPCTGGWNSQASWTVDALNWASSISARVTNNSNIYGFTSAAIETAYNNTRNAGMVHFAAAGNNASPTISYPSSLASVNAVAAMSRTNTRAPFSNFGTGLDFSAPGDDIFTADRTGGDGYVAGDFVTVDGTSFASPIAAGVAALILSQNSGLSAAQVEQRMQQGCVDLGTPGYDTNFGWGFVNAFNSLDQPPQGCSELESFGDPLGPWTTRWLYQNSNLENYYVAQGGNCDPNNRGNNPCGLWIADSQGCSSGVGGTVSEIVFDAPFADRIRSLSFDVRAFGATTVTFFNPAGGQLAQFANINNGVFPVCGGQRVSANSPTGIRRVRFERASGNVEGNTAIDDVCVTLAAPETCDVIDFQALEHRDNLIVNHGNQVDEDGYRLTKGTGEAFPFATRGTLDTNYPGSTALFNNTVNGLCVLRRIDGAVFNVTSIDLANLNGSGPAPVTFTGFYPGGGTVVLNTDTGDPNGLPNTLQTIEFRNTFCGLERLEWRQASPFHQFDNIRVATPTRIDFESLAQAGTGTRDNGVQYDEDGYRLTKNPGEPFNFASFQTGAGRFPGSTSLFNNTVNGNIILQRIDGGPFDACEISLANLNGGGPAPVNFVGTRLGGGTVNHNTNTGDPNGLPNVLARNVFPTSFRGLTKLEWRQEDPFHQFDDIIVACSTVTVRCPCACNYDTSTGPNVCDIFDFLEFQNRFAASDPCACDEDLSTGPNVCDIFDFLEFQNGFSAGCP